MYKRKLWKNIIKSITATKGRFFSILSLMALGTFAFVGLKVTGPDMRATAENFYQKTHLADMTLTSTWGLDASDRKKLEQTEGIAAVEYGYFQDLTFKNSKTSVRLFSKPRRLSQYEIVAGHLPETGKEVALDYQQRAHYKLGDKVTFDQSENKWLKRSTYKIVGFVKSSEITETTGLGQTTVGSGTLNSYGVVTPENFAAAGYTIARLSFSNTQNLDPYSSEYDHRVLSQQKKLVKLFNKQGKKRLTAKKKDEQKKIDRGRQKVAQTKKELTTAKKQLEKAQQQLQAGQRKIEANQAQLEETLPQTIVQGQLAQVQAQLDDQQEEYEKQKAAYEKHKQQAAQTLPQKEKQLDQAQQTLAKLKAPHYAIDDRKDGTLGYKQYLENSQRVDVLSNVFPVFLFAIAALVSLTTMTRFVEEERIDSGTLKALGYSNWDIEKKFVFYGFVAGTLGAVLGTVLGHTLLPTIIFKAYAASSTFSKVSWQFSPFYSVVGLVIALLCTTLSAYVAATQELKEKTAQLLLPKPPKEGSRILLERVTPLWQRLNFTFKVTARNLFRYKKRMFMTIFGVAGCTALLITGFGIHDSLTGITAHQFNDLIKYDLIVKKAEDISNKQQKKIVEKLKKPAIKRAAEVYYEQLTVRAGQQHNTQDIVLVVPKNLAAFKEDVELVNRQTRQKISLSKDGVILSEKLAKLLQAKAGSSVALKDEEGKQHKIKVAGITEMYMGHYAYMSPAAYQNYFGSKAKANSYLVTLNKKNESEKEAGSFMELSGIQTVVQSSALSQMVDNVINGLNNVILVLIICATLLAIVVIYNLTNINVSERIRELSTIKVLGFYDWEVTMYIYRETILLSILGILAGFGIGYLLHGFIMYSLPPDQAMFSPSLLWTNFALSAGITLGITLLLMLVIHRKLKKVDMLAALKSVD